MRKRAATLHDRLPIVQVKRDLSDGKSLNVGRQEKWFDSLSVATYKYFREKVIRGQQLEGNPYLLCRQYVHGPASTIIRPLFAKRSKMPVSWNESMSTGVPEVDNQHKELIRQLGLLNDAMLHGQGRREIGKILDFLGDYVVAHFATEEKQMERLACTAAANKRAHSEFLASFKGFRKRFEEAGASTTLVLEINNTISDWLVDHIAKIDTQLNTCAVNA